MSKYDLGKITADVFPAFWQKDANLNLLALIVGIFEPVNRDLGDTEEKARDNLSYSIQVGSLESYLNSSFDMNQERIFITRTGKKNSTYTFDNATAAKAFKWFTFDSALSVSIDELRFTYNSVLTVLAGFKYIVNVPTDFVAFEAEIIAAIERVNIYSLDYKILYF